jgi:hypothetical protein
MEQQPPIGLYVYRRNPQAHGSIIVEFQGIIIYIFPKEGRDNKWSDMSMSKANIYA